MAQIDPGDEDEGKPLSLEAASERTLEEARMVVPGIQALFGFQLMAVFSEGFPERLGPLEQGLHFAATGLVAISIALIMTPAAFDRQTGSRTVTASFLRLSTRFLVWSMVPLAVGICLEFFLIGKVIVGDGVLAPALAAALFALFIVLWFVLPRAKRLQRLICGK